MQKLKVTNDFVFKKIFGKQENEEILKDLLIGILKIPINKVEIIKDINLEKLKEENKTGILDIQATIDGDKKINIEMQVKNEYNIKERTLYYWSGMYYNELKKGEKYNTIKKAISINIINFNCFKEGPYHETCRIKRDYNNENLTDKLEIHFIQIPKAKEKGIKIESKLDEWMQFIIGENERGIEKAMKNNQAIQKAVKELEYLTGDEETQRILYLREKAERDEYNNIEGAREEGKIEEKIKIARKMLKENMAKEIIIKVTGLTKEEIEKLN